MCACREREAFSSITSQMSRMLRHVKRKHKVFAVQHAFVLDFLAAPPSSSPAFTPSFPFFSSHTRPSKPSTIPHFAPPSPSPLQPTTYSTPSTLNSSPLCIHDAPRSVPDSPQCILRIHPHPQKKHLHAHPSPPLYSNPSPLSASAAPCQGEHSAHRTLRVFILLTLLCTFLCIGKEIAFVVAMATHLILGFLARGSNVNYAAQASNVNFDISVEKDNMVCSNAHMRLLNRSWTVPRSNRSAIVTSLRWSRRSKSWTKLHGSVEGEMQQPSKVGDSTSSECSERRVTISSPRRGNLSAKMKLQVVLLCTLGGLFHGRFLAMCMALSCILIYSKMERLFFKKRRL